MMIFSDGVCMGFSLLSLAFRYPLAPLGSLRRACILLLSLGRWPCNINTNTVSNKAE
jgi:hypothetical protein